MSSKNKKYKSLKYIMIVIKDDSGNVKTIKYEFKKMIKKDDVLLVDINGDSNAELNTFNKEELPDNINELLN